VFSGGSEAKGRRGVVSESKRAAFEVPVEGVVVGHDGSDHGQAALVWGMEDAARRGTVVHVIRAWVLSSAMRDMKAPFGTIPSLVECEEAIRSALSASVARARAAKAPDVVVHEHLVHGPPAPALIAASVAADVVVVGNRGRGGFAGLILGATAEHVLRHARCSVVLVR
jgi:nucleotide-binding universal stress UspA family protein